MHAGAKHVVVCDVEGVVHEGREGLDESLQWIADNTNADKLTGTLRDALPGADVFIGVSAPNLLNARGRRVDGRRLDRLRAGQPRPGDRPGRSRASTHAVVATGRSDYPNQINNVLAFPGIFRGLLDAQSHGIGMDILLAAAEAIAGSVSSDELNANYIVPSVFHADVHKRVAAAVRKAAEAADGKEH